MKYGIIMLCGGESMMLTPSPKPKLDLLAVTPLLGDTVLRSSKDMVEFMYHDVKLTLYPNGSVMFYHFIDLEIARTYADEILELVRQG
ncbi:MAG: hypothetical protein IJT54_02265 [Candidatus Methanomethylophilaceae archaeon]|nr:hypothetical protein [Candidatus Methanomethylophilaceae archaeon]